MWKRKDVDRQFSNTRTRFCGKDEMAEESEYSTEYPSELVEYMKQVVCIIRDDPSASGELTCKHWFKNFITSSELLQRLF